MQETDVFKVVNDEGKEVVCYKLCTFDSEETGKSYVIYTDNTKDKDGAVQVYASIYDPKDANSKLEPIETEKEWKVVETILTTIKNEITSSQNNGNN